VFAFRETLDGDLDHPVVEVAFTDASVDLQGLRPGFGVELDRVEVACGVRFARLNQVHGADVLLVDEPGPGPLADVPSADALVTGTADVGLMIRVADCVPVLLADPRAGVIAAVHAGRAGTRLDVVTRTVDRMRDQGATDPVAWIGPHVCGGCYEVPEEMRATVSAVVPAAYSETTWGTPALDLGAGIRAQLDKAGVSHQDVGGCTREDQRLHSHRRDAAAAGRMAGLIWMRP
jgi:polyphenol oxidase